LVSHMGATLFILMVGFYGIYVNQHSKVAFNKITHQYLPVIESLSLIHTSYFRIISETNEEILRYKMEMVDAEEQKETIYSINMLHNALSDYEKNINRHFPDEKNTAVEIRLVSEGLIKYALKIKSELVSGVTKKEQKDYVNILEGIKISLIS